MKKCKVLIPVALVVTGIVLAVKKFGLIDKIKGLSKKK